MIQANCRQPRILRAMLSLFIVTLLFGVPIGFAADSAAPSSSAQEQKNQPAETGDIQERGLTKVPPGKVQEDTKVKPQRTQPGGGLPAKLCHEVTHMRTECRCANSTDCQIPVDALSWLMSRRQSELSVHPIIPRHAASTASESVRVSGAVDNHAVLL